MGRIARIVLPGMAHHVVQRGNRRQERFFCDDDYRAYLSVLVEWCGRWGTRIWAYCLMGNHVHLIVVPTKAEGLGRAIGEAHRRYTRRVNFREGWRGYLWQGRFSSFVMDERYLLAATQYVERNPVKAGLVGRAEDWPWSSAAAHVAGRGDAVAEGAWLGEMTAGWVCSWGEYLRDSDEGELAAQMRHGENTGRPLGDESFLNRLSAILGRDLLPKKRGPKKKANN
ncbi:MAG TPA: transposase [Marinobacter sp.]|uniref:Transposase IS200-like domain-containing protein n=1 Tax=marine sediment metagenome TaxID=412755 RepID=A0A0F9KQD1_9ZZZZ|nr:transposase [Marinobacter sp.]